MEPTNAMRAAPSTDLVSRFELGATIDLGDLREGLFEQLLTMPFQSTVPPERSEPPTPPSEPDLESQSSTDENAQNEPASGADAHAFPVLDTTLQTRAEADRPPAKWPRVAESRADEEEAIVTSDTRRKTRDAESPLASHAKSSPGSDPAETQPQFVQAQKVGTSREQTVEVDALPRNRLGDTEADLQNNRNGNAAANESELGDQVAGREIRQDGEGEESLREHTEPSSTTLDQPTRRRDGRSKWYEGENAPAEKNQLGDQHISPNTMSVSGPAEVASGGAGNLGEPSLTDQVTVMQFNAGESSPGESSPWETTSALAGMNVPDASPSSLSPPATAHVSELGPGASSEKNGGEQSSSHPTSQATGRPEGRKQVANTARPVTTGDKDTSGVTQQQRVRLIQRIARGFSRLSPTGGQINLRLHPPHLGSLAVQVRLEGRDITAKLTTETAAAREIILESLPALRSRLAEQGFDISQFQVEVVSQDTDGSTNTSQQRSGQHPHSDSGMRGEPGTPIDNRRRMLVSERPSAVDVGQESPVASWLLARSIDLQM